MEPIIPTIAAAGRLGLPIDVSGIRRQRMRGGRTSQPEPDSMKPTYAADLESVCRARSVCLDLTPKASIWRSVAAAGGSTCPSYCWYIAACRGKCIGEVEDQRHSVDDVAGAQRAKLR